MSVTSVLRKISTRGAKCAAVVVAAGKATRMEGTDKIMAELCGEPLIVHTLRALQQSEDVQEIVLVTRDELLQPLSDQGNHPRSTDQHLPSTWCAGRRPCSCENLHRRGRQ